MRLIPMAVRASPWLQQRKEPDEEQLLRLFWNRAELKKELARLRREREKLIDQLRQQEGVNLRAQQRLEQLENLLADPLQANNAAVYYQLRGVWSLGRRRLQRLARELADRQQDREEGHAQRLFERLRDGEIGSLDEKIADLAGRVRAMESDLRAAGGERQRLRGFWNYFRRRRADDQGEAIRAALEGVHAQVDRLVAERRERELESAPNFGGLSIEGRRNINLAVIALAQQLLVELAEHNVAGLAREASIRPLAEVVYGSLAECRALSRNIAAVQRRLENGETLNGQIRQRTEYLRRRAQYRRDADVVPVAGLLGSIPVLVPDEGEPVSADAHQIQVNVLADEYWDIYASLLT